MPMLTLHPNLWMNTGIEKYVGSMYVVIYNAPEQKQMILLKEKKMMLHAIAEALEIVSLEIVDVTCLGPRNLDRNTTVSLLEVVTY